jgi:serine/threonine protein phosphatase PrpC
MNIKTSWISFAGTHVGKIRTINQDAFANYPEKRLWAVADGMGGHKSGELASQAIVNALKNLKPCKSIGVTVKNAYHELNRVNTSLIKLAAKETTNEVIGSTVAILIASEHHCIFLWSGDSRVYLFRDNKLKQLSRDHNNENILLENGYSEEDLINIPYAQSLTHAIGAEKQLYLDAQIQEVKHNDIFLLCSDGLNKEVTDNEIENMLNNQLLEELVPNFIELTLERGARDNVTIVLVRACFSQSYK